jgi:hypothetical protein
MTPLERLRLFTMMSLGFFVVVASLLFGLRRAPLPRWGRQLLRALAPVAMALGVLLAALGLYLAWNVWFAWRRGGPAEILLATTAAAFGLSGCGFYMGRWGRSQR